MPFVLPALPGQPGLYVSAETECGSAGLCITQEHRVDAPTGCINSAKVWSPTKLPSLRQYGRCSLSGSRGDDLLMSSEHSNKLHETRQAMPLDAASGLVAEQSAAAMRLEEVALQTNGVVPKVSRCSRMYQAVSLHNLAPATHMFHAVACAGS